MRKLILALALATSSTLSADTADLQITSLTASKSNVTAGEIFSVALQWRNDGPDQANDVTATVAMDSGAFVLVGLGSENWLCEPIFGGNGFRCRGFLPAGGTGKIDATMLAKSQVTDAPFTITGHLAASTSDPQPANNTASLQLPLTASATAIDLVIGPESQEHRAAPNAELSIPLVVRNRGTQRADDVRVSIAFEPGSQTPLSASGTGWICGNLTHSPQLVLCTLRQLDANATSSLTVQGIAPASGKLRLYARTAAPNANDPAANNVAVADVIVREEVQQYTRILVPLPPGVTPGVNGAQWTTQTTALLRSQIPIFPGPCETIIVLCPGPIVFPVMQPFPLGAWQLRGSGLGEFVILRKEHASQIRLNSRVWDAAREAETAGSEIPIAREDDFVSTPIALVGIPLAEHYRNTLRVYDLDGHDGARVAIRIYADDEPAPRATTTATLTVYDDAFPTTDEQLSTRPASLQLDPLQLASLAGASLMRIEVEPLDPGVKIWSFLSVTNNTTHHVTTFSAH